MPKKKEQTTIAVSKGTARRLRGKRQNPKDTYEDIVRRLMDL